MKHMTFTLRTNLLSKLLLSLALLLGSVDVWADELTINGTSTTESYYVPFYSSKLNSDDLIGCGQFILPSTALSDMKDGDISQMKFYVSAGTSFLGAEHSVYVKEVDKTVFTSNVYDDWNEMTNVYAGALSVSSSEVTITFSSSYRYNGGNLLIGFKQTKKSTVTPTPGIKWVGKSASGNVANSYKFSDIGYTSFLPKITFNYTPPITSTLIISPDEDADFGTVWDNATKTNYYTITNNSASTVNVTANIAGTDASSFSVSPSAAQDIASGESQTYSITYTYDSSSLGDKTATITFTPDEDGTNAITKNITANAISDNAPELSVTPDEDSDLGMVYEGDVTYTVTNTGTGSMTVNISSDNSDFVLDKSSIANLAHGESETFTVTYTFDPTVEKLGLNSANITVTPTYVGGVAKTYEVSATSNADFTVDEENYSPPVFGEKNYLHVKYTPTTGWNTICVPFMLKSSTMNNMDVIFGEGWKAYTLNAYNNGTLTFKKLSSSDNVQNGTPYLVYIESAPSHPKGVLLSNLYVYTSAAGSTTKGDATFSGTYVRKDYEAEDNWYGVTPAGKIMKAGTGAFVRGYRAYFTGVSAPSAGAEVKMFIIGGDDIPTDVGFVKMVDADAKEVYNLAGQRIQKARKGIYIVNGKKVVIK